MAVKKQGYYKITEICDWSNTDYDYCLKSNRYKGYLDSETSANNKLYADYETTKDNTSPLKDSVIIYVGELDDMAFPYTLGCEYFTAQNGTVKYTTKSTQNVLVQKRDENGSLLYYVSGTEGDTTTEKYDTQGNRRNAVPAQLSDFRIQDTVTVDGTEKILFFDAAHTEPVWKYVDGLEDSAYEQENTGTEENPSMSVKKYPVYDDKGNLINNITRRKLSDSTQEENYRHDRDTLVFTNTVYTLNTADSANRPMASFSNVESEYALLSSNSWAENRIKVSDENS